VTLGGIAGLIAAIAFLLLVGAVGWPLIRLARVFDELRGSVKDLTVASVPILTELESTVVATNDELGKLAVVTEDVATVSGKASDVATDVSRVTTLVSQTIAVPFIKVAAVMSASKRAIRGWGKK
jgi:uncharacterized protein YoxC